VIPSALPAAAAADVYAYVEQSRHANIFHIQLP
jgi:hypothetical protein